MASMIDLTIAGRVYQVACREGEEDNLRARRAAGRRQEPRGARRPRHAERSAAVPVRLAAARRPADREEARSGRGTRRPPCPTRSWPPAPTRSPTGWSCSRKRSRLPDLRSPAIHRAGKNRSAPVTRGCRMNFHNRSCGCRRHGRFRDNRDPTPLRMVAHRAAEPGGPRRRRVPADQVRRRAARNSGEIAGRSISLDFDTGAPGIPI